jgi:hypothetical protein
MKGKDLDYISVLAGAAAGILAGGICGYILGRAIQKKAGEARITREIEEFRNSYTRRYPQGGVAAKERDNQNEGSSSVESGGGTWDPDPDPNPSHIVTTGELRSWGPYATGMGSIIAVHEMPDQPADETPGWDDPSDRVPGHPDGTDDEDDDGEDDGDDDGIEEDPGPDPVLELERRSTPYGISSAEFTEEREEYNKISLNYYEGDSVLTDDKDVPIRDFIKVVGKDFVSLFGKDENPDLAHVRNDRLESDFEIARVLGTWTAHAQGYGRPL